MFRSISKCLSSYSTIFRRIVNEVLRFRETLVEKNKGDDSARCVAYCSVLHIQKADILICLYNVLLVNISTSEEANTKHVGFVA
jgi:hypothetical protein